MKTEDRERYTRVLEAPLHQVPSSPPAPLLAGRKGEQLELTAEPAKGGGKP